MSQTRHTTKLLLLGVLSLSSAGYAQDLGAYRTLAAQLDAAAAGAGQNALTTLKQLDAAQAALEKLGPTLTNTNLATALRDNMNAIRAAQARTPAELQAQVLLARGLMRKGLYDQTMNLLATAPAGGSNQLKLLSQELGADPVAAAADLKAGKLNLVAWRLQKSAAGKLNAALGTVKAQQSAGNYLNLARAASWFTVVQDAGRSVEPALNAGQFNQALAQVAGGQLGELQTSLQTLRTGVSALNRSLAAPPTAVVSQPGGGGKATTIPPVIAPPTSAPTPTPTPAVADTRPKVAGAAPAYAGLARALTASARADLPAARAELLRVNQALGEAPQALRSAPGFNTLVQHVQGLSQRQAVRPSDVQALMSELSAIEQGRPLTLTENMAGLSSRTLGGGLRAILALLLALACAAPLYLLNLAFGGKNPFWRAISAALVLLMLPTLADGLFGLLGWMGDAMNVPFLRGLLTLLPGQSAFGVPLRLLTTALALGLATYGFRGLCVQFGLLGGRKPAAAKAEAKPTKPKNPDQTSFDWDEEV